MTEPTPAGDVGREGSTAQSGGVGGSANKPDLAGLLEAMGRACDPERSYANKVLVDAATEIRALRKERDALREALTQLTDREYWEVTEEETHEGEWTGDYVYLCRFCYNTHGQHVDDCPADIASRALTPHPPAHPNPAGTTEER